MPRKWQAVPAVLFALIVAAVTPRLYGGWWNLTAAKRASALGEYAEAAGLLERAASQLPWRTDLWQEAGIDALRGGKADEAILLLERAEGLGPLSADGSIDLGAAYWTSSDFGAAITAWEGGRALHPSDPRLLDRLIPAYEMLGDYTKERAALVTRLELGNDAAASYRLGLLLMLDDSGEASAQLQRAASQDARYGPAVTTLEASIQEAAAQPDRASRQVVLGRGLALVDEWRLASGAFLLAVNTDNQNAEAWAWLGEAQQQQGQDGSQALDEALRLDPQDVVVHGLRALYWTRRGNYAAALKEQKQAAAIEPQNAGLQSSLGEAYAAAGDLVSALSAYEQATILAPNDPSGWRQLAAFCADNGIQVQQIGLPAAQKASELAPHDAQVLDTLGWSYAQAGLPYTARQTLRASIEAAPDLASAHLHLGETLLQIGDYASAQQELKQALALDSAGPVGALATQLLQQYFP